jgi:hypothetical protein
MRVCALAMWVLASIKRSSNAMRDFMVKMGL